MQRAELIETLKQVAPALASKDFVPVLACFCFDGKLVTAFDDLVALQAPCTLPIKAGIRGRLMLDLLTASRAKELVLDDASEQEIVLKAGRSRIKLPRIDPEHFIFEMPEPEGVAVPLSDKVIDALKRVAISMGTDPSHPWRMGVTLLVTAEGISFYSSDNVTVSRARVEQAGLVKKKDTFKCVLAPRFVELLLSQAAKREGTLNLTSGWSMACFKSGLKLFCKTVNDLELERYEHLFEAVSQMEERLVPIPKGTDLALQRALALLDGATDKLTELTVRDGVMSLFSKSQHGEVRDRLRFADHPDAKTVIQPEMLHRAIPHSSHMAVDPELAVLLIDEDFDHIISIVEG